VVQEENEAEKDVLFKESPFAKCVSGAPRDDYFSRSIPDCGEYPFRTLHSRGSPPLDGIPSSEKYHAIFGATW